jgi:outer membrane receptor protein involved in Fe transport
LSTARLEHGFPFGVANVPVNLLERVEIYRGVVPVGYASDALGGAVHFVSDQSFENRFAGSYQLGSYGTRRATLFGRYRSARRPAWRVGESGHEHGHAYEQS